MHHSGALVAGAKVCRDAGLDAEALLRVDGGAGYLVHHSAALVAGAKACRDAGLDAEALLRVHGGAGYLVHHSASLIRGYQDLSSACGSKVMHRIYERSGATLPPVCMLLARPPVTVTILVHWPPRLDSKSLLLKTGCKCSCCREWWCVEAMQQSRRNCPGPASPG